VAPYLALAAALPVEFVALVGMRDWSRFGSRKPLVIGFLGVAAFALLLCLAAPVLSGRPVAGFLGMYIFSALSWAWWRDGHSPADWSLGEALTALLASGLFSIAASAT
jgi:drug/metabolite transporter superfamily protein YnfA